MPIHNPLFAMYTARCTHPGCGGIRRFEQAQSAGLRPGDKLPYDPQYPEATKCPRCKRYTLEVTKVPDPPELPSPKGFVKVPEE